MEPGKADCRWKWAPAWVLAVLVGGGPAFTDEIDFEKQVWPIFQTRCNDCHNGETREGQLRLDARSGFLAGGVSGRLVHPKDTNRSPLLQRILGHGDLDRMPLDEDPLTVREIDTIRQWLKEGAAWPEGVGARVDLRQTHWAYQKPRRPEIPQRDNLPKGNVGDSQNGFVHGRFSRDWVRNPIDHFVLERMRREGLAPSRPATRSKQLRRLYFDLVGIPPTADQMRTFLADDSPNAYERVVDQLLASPRFGEKWARSWLDLARYADTNGFQADQFRSVWPYRDWVIDAMNQGMPFDQFTIEQLAGDLLRDATVSQKIATGFHRLTTCNVEAGVDPEENRVNQIIDRVNTTGTVWFGTTFECMQCHNHKYDPFTQREYYQMFAFFNNTPLEVRNSGNNIQYEFSGPSMKLPLNRELRRQTEEIQFRLAELKKEIAKARTARLSGFSEWQVAARASSEKMEDWTPLKVDSFHSRAGATHRILDDQSVLVSGKNGDKDFYTVLVSGALTEVNGFRFETLVDDSLPSRGPGRNPLAGKPNFVVNEIRGYLLGDTEKPLSLTQPLADFSQSRFDVQGAFDGNPSTGWAINPQFGKPHWATVLVDPLKRAGQDKKIRFKFTFDHQYGGGRNIGRLRVSALRGRRNTGSLPGEIRKLLTGKPLSKKEDRQLRDFFLAQDPALKKLKQKEAALDKELASIQPTTTLVMVEEAKRMTAVFKRGDFLQQGEAVTTATPRVLHPGKKAVKQNRLDFARWIVDSDNPLTARVVVNRWWAEIFGRGLVSTGEDFGTQGEPPTHPKLLDWLALEFIDSGWSMKKTIRSIVLSSTYRQSSVFTPTGQARDPGNRFLARGPRFRLSAESIRDNALVVTDQFSSRMGGAPVYPPQPTGVWRHVGRNEPKYVTSEGADRHRRGIYVFWRRSAPYPSFVNFDAPDRAACVVNRPRTNTPLQALTLLNDQAFNELHLAFAREIFQAGGSAREKLMQAFIRCTLRTPKPVELEYLVSFLDSRMELYREHPEQAGKVAGEGPDAIPIAAWTAVARILLNLDETITKD